MLSDNSESDRSLWTVSGDSLEYDPNTFRNRFGMLMTGVAGLFTIAAIIPLFVVLSYLVVNGIENVAFSSFFELPPQALTEDRGGFGNALLGTLTMVSIGLGLSVPIGIMSGIYLSEFSPPKVAYWLRFATNVLSGVPSIIVGTFAYGVLVVTLKSYSAWAGGFALAILMLPIIVRTTDEALKLIPQDVRQASVGIGANDYQTVLQIVVPSAVPAIITGVTLAVARAAGETAPLLYTAGFNQFWPEFNFQALSTQPISSLSVLIYQFGTSPYENQQQLAWAASFILMMLVMLSNLIARVATSRKQF
ncbi:MAG: phosphate ABC transporter permease PstA [Prochloraceae cyanobacterium]